MIYLDNASTSYPKAPGVGAEMARYVEQIGVNVSRGDYAPAQSVQNTLIDLREQLCEMFGSACVEGAILTSGATQGLNMVLKGYLHPGDHVLVSSMEHNAVMRPLHQIACAGVTVERIPCNADGTLDPTIAATLFRPNTRMLCVTHASNVCGTLLPISALGALCHEHGVAFVVDASQTVGHVPINCTADHIDALVFSAHKGLLGPQGIGAALMTRSFAETLTPLMSGGTGSRSDMEEQPTFLPDKLECGTPNLPGIYGFLHSLRFVRSHMDEFAARSQMLCKRLLGGLAAIPGIRVPGVADETKRVSVVSVDFVDIDNAQAAYTLEKEYGIFTRCGLHCAPSAHKTIGTFPKGTVRLSLGYANTAADVDAALAAIRAICEKR